MSAETDLWEGFDPLAVEEITGPVWDEPVPLTARRDLPVFPVHALPAWLGNMVAAVAEETQTPADLAGCLALAVVATAAGGRAMVCVRGRWREPVNLYTAVVLDPGNRKSAVFALMTEPLMAVEKTLVELSGPARAEAEIYAAMRPAEAVGLREQDCYLPEKGWGTLTLRETRPVSGKKWTDTGKRHDKRGVKSREAKADRPVPISAPAGQDASGPHEGIRYGEGRAALPERAWRRAGHLQLLACLAGSASDRAASGQGELRSRAGPTTSGTPASRTD